MKKLHYWLTYSAKDRSGEWPTMSRYARRDQIRFSLGMRLGLTFRRFASRSEMVAEAQALAPEDLFVREFGDNPWWTS
jgi:hypothetical protein